MRRSGPLIIVLGFLTAVARRCAPYAAFEECGQEFDLAGLADVIRKDGRRFLEDVALAIKVFEKRIRTAFLRMTGVYGPLDFPFMTAGPVYEFVFSLPGELVETNGNHRLLS